MPIVSNSGPILSFARAARLELLRAATAEIIVPDAVYQEVVLAEADRPGAKAALRLGIAHFGCLRILKELKDRRLIPAVKPVLDELVQSGAYLAPDLYRDFLRRLMEK